ncbi:hypothetical protein [Nostoc sp.]|uniref:hypothetical protein n=1 Tax=Nostoc sp. TaxID=1180 RepID=UPI002FF6AE0F
MTNEKRSRLVRDESAIALSNEVRCYLTESSLSAPTNFVTNLGRVGQLHPMPG